MSACHVLCDQVLRCSLVLWNSRCQSTVYLIGFLVLSYPGLMLSWFSICGALSHPWGFVQSWSVTPSSSVLSLPVSRPVRCCQAWPHFLRQPFQTWPACRLKTWTINYCKLAWTFFKQKRTQVEPEFTCSSLKPKRDAENPSAGLLLDSNFKIGISASCRIFNLKIFYNFQLPTKASSSPRLSCWMLQVLMCLNRVEVPEARQVLFQELLIFLFWPVKVQSSTL